MFHYILLQFGSRFHCLIHKSGFSNDMHCENMYIDVFPKIEHFNIADSQFSRSGSIIIQSFIHNIQINSCSFHKLNQNIFLASERMAKVSKRLIVGDNTNIVKNTLFDYIITDKDGSLFAQKIQFLVKDCVFSNNQANNGGAVAIINCSSDFLTSNFTRCFAINKAGAIHAIDSTLNIENQHHYGCECEAIGGAAIFKKCTVGIKLSNYLKCRAYSVAVFYLDGNVFSCSNSNFLFNVCKNNLSPLIQTFYNSATFYMCYFKNNSKGELLSVSEGIIFVENSFLEDNITFQVYNNSENIKIKDPILVEPQISLNIIRPEKRKLIFLNVDESGELMPLIKSISLITIITIVSYLLLPSAKKSSIYEKGETIHPEFEIVS